MRIDPSKCMSCCPVMNNAHILIFKSANFEWPVGNQTTTQEILSIFIDNSTSFAYQGWGGYVIVCRFFLSTFIRTNASIAKCWKYCLDHTQSHHFGSRDCCSVLEQLCQLHRRDHRSSRTINILSMVRWLGRWNLRYSRGNAKHFHFFVAPFNLIAGYRSSDCNDFSSRSHRKR